MLVGTKAMETVNRGSLKSTSKQIRRQVSAQHSRKDHLHQLVRGMIVLLTLLPLGLTSAETRERAIESPIYQTDNLYIAPDSNASTTRWCKQDRSRRYGATQPGVYGFVVRYSVAHDQRDALFAPDYEQFVLDEIVSAIESACRDIADIPEVYTIHLQMSNEQKGGRDVVRDMYEFRFQAGRVFTTSYAPGAEMIAGKTTEEIQTMRNVVPKRLDRLDAVVGQIGPFTLYPHAYPLCTRGGVEVDAVFSIPAEERDDWIESKYGNTINNGFDLFFQEDVLPALQKACRGFGQVRVYFYEEGAIERWDSMTFEVKAPGYLQSPTYNGLIIAQDFSERARLFRTAELSNELFGECNDGPFCDKLGGVYLDAIYRNDVATVRRINAELDAEYQSRSAVQQVAKLLQILSDAGVDSVDGLSSELQFLIWVSGKYMYDFSRLATTHQPGDGLGSAACFRPGAKEIDTRAVSDVVHYEDQRGIYQGSVGGIEIGKVYSINPEFLPLANKIASAGSGGMGDFLASEFDLKKSRAILGGLERMISEHPCQSPEIRQFERNLISLTERYLSNRSGTSRVDAPETSTPPTNNTTPIPIKPPARSASEAQSGAGASEPRRMRSRSSQTEAKTVPNRTEQVPIRRSVQRGSAPASGSVDKQQAMMAEIRVVTEALTKAHQAKINEYGARLKNASSMAEQRAIRTELIEFQQSAALELQDAMAEIQEKYR